MEREGKDIPPPLPHKWYSPGAFRKERKKLEALFYLEGVKTAIIAQLNTWKQDSKATSW